MLTLPDTACFVSDGIDSVVLRRCLEGLSEVVDAAASMEDRDIVVSVKDSKQVPAILLLAVVLIVPELEHIIHECDNREIGTDTWCTGRGWMYFLRRHDAVVLRVAAWKACANLSMLPPAPRTEMPT